MYGMRGQAETNKRAWEYRAYEFWSSQATPAEKAAQLRADPEYALRHFRRELGDVRGQRIANICGSNGRVAVPLALLGARATVFDISEENRRYALELAGAAGVPLAYVLGDICEADEAAYGGAFDIVFAEGGILHYFLDIGAFMRKLYALARPGGRLVLSDFHPFRKVNPRGSSMMSAPQTGGDYFDTRVHEAAVAYEGFFDEAERAAFPKCSVRLYTVSEIVNAVLGAGFTLTRLDERPSYDDARLPGILTVLATK